MKLISFKHLVYFGDEWYFQPFNLATYRRHKSGDYRPGA